MYMYKKEELDTADKIYTYMHNREELDTANKVERYVLIALIPISLFRWIVLLIILSLIELGLIIYKNKLNKEIEEEENNWIELQSYLGEMNGNGKVDEMKYKIDKAEKELHKGDK